MKLKVKDLRKIIKESSMGGDPVDEFIGKITEDWMSEAFAQDHHYAPESVQQREKEVRGAAKALKTKLLDLVEDIQSDLVQRSYYDGYYDEGRGY